MLILTSLAIKTSIVVMIHGAGGGGWEYEKWQPVFEKAGYRVVARDLEPAAGGLEKTTLDDYVGQVISWVPTQRDDLVIIGVSMGGIVALRAAEKLSPRAVVLVNSVPPMGIGESPTKPHPPIIRWANGPINDTRDSMPDSDEATILWAHPKWRDESGAVLNALRATPVKPPVKCLVVLGENDSDIPSSTGLEVARWAKADVQMYAGMSHVGPLLSTRAERVATSIVDWLRP